jgi:hypothetical protein
MAVSQPPRPSVRELWQQAGGGTGSFSKEKFLSLWPNRSDNQEGTPR